MENTNTVEVVSFDDLFKFTNATDEEFRALWNNKEYIFPPKSTAKMIIQNESLENMQEIRKRFALRLAEREYRKTESFQKIKNGDGQTVLSQYDMRELQPWIDQCLEPLAVEKLKIETKSKDSDRNYKASKSLDQNTDLNQAFKDMPVEEQGMMSV